MDRSGPEVADVFRRYGDAYRERHGESLSTAQRRAMTAIEICRTAALGGHVEQCDTCGHQRISYCSCRNRHCPKCTNHWPALSGWMTAVPRFSSTQYFHVVFTLPAELAAIALQNKAVVYGILFRTVARRNFADDRLPPTRSILVWRSASSPFSTRGVQFVTPSASSRGRARRWAFAGWKPMDLLPVWRYFLPVQVLSRLFRRLFTEALERAFTAGQLAFFSALAHLKERDAFQRYLAPVRRAEWVVYAKRPFAGPEQVLEHVGRYTHRVAISNNRILDIEDGKVRFQWKDYRRGGQQKPMTLDADEFIRCFLRGGRANSDGSISGKSA